MVVKRLLKYSSVRLLMFLVALFLLIVIPSVLQKSREKIFTECVEHVDNSKTHTHTMLTIIQNGDKVSIPNNLGITSRCMHPLHTHDDTGLIHMEYSKPMKFYLGDFFDLMGVVFNDKQIGSLKNMDGYKISVKRNGKLIKTNYRLIPLIDLEKIEIKITSGKN